MSVFQHEPRPRTHTVVTDVKPERFNDLKLLLEKTNLNIKNGQDKSFLDLKGLHYLRWLTLEPTDDGKFGPKLIYSAVSDSHAREHFLDLASTENEQVKAIYECCEGFPEGTPRVSAIADYLNRNNRGAIASFRAVRGHNLERILNEEKLYLRIRSYIAQRREEFTQGLRASDIRFEIQEYVKKQTDLGRWATQRVTRPHLLDITRRYLFLLIAVVILASGVLWTAFHAALIYLTPYGNISWPVLAFLYFVPIVGLLVRIGVLLISEEMEAQDPLPIMDEKRIAFLNELMVNEDWGNQNPMSLSVFVKRSPFRTGNLKAVMHSVNLAARFILYSGDLAGIRSIHFADWVMFDGDRRMLFLSNYDGSWEGYLSEFLEGLARDGFNAVYSNTRGYPHTMFFIEKGITRQASLFKQLVRDRQTPTQVWFARYDHLTVENIIANLHARIGLWGAMPEEACRQWLRLF